MKLTPMYKALLEKTKEFITVYSKDKDITSDEYLGNFSYSFWDYWEKLDMEALKPVTTLLLSSQYKNITERNLAIANANSNWKKVSIERIITEYLNDYLNYLTPRIVNLDNWEEDFNKNYEIFEKEYLSDEFTVDFFGHLVNFWYKFEGTGEINDHTKIVILQSLDHMIKYELLCKKRADYFRVINSLPHSFPVIDKEKIKKQPYYLHYSKKIKKFDSSGKPFNPYYLMRKFITGIRVLSRHGKPYCDFITAFHQGRLSSCGFPYSFSFPESQLDTNTGLDIVGMGHPEETWLERLWVKLEDMDYLDRLVAFDHHLDDSLRRENRSSKNPYKNELKVIDELDRLSDYFSAFDSIYKVTKRDKKRPISQITAEYTARLVTYKRNPKDNRNPKDWVKVAEFIKDMYKIRNHYEHGRFRDALRKAGKFEHFRDRVYTIGGYLRQVAILYIMNDNFEKQLPKIDQGNFSGLKNIYY